MPSGALDKINKERCFLHQRKQRSYYFQDLALVSQILLVGFDHLLDHLAADRARLAGGQVAVVALLQVDANLIAARASGTIP